MPPSFSFTLGKFMKNIICIEGPTASGKSDLAFGLAKVFDTEIVSADSRQVYKYLNIGTAKPNEKLSSEVKHHLIDIITPDKRYSAGAFVKDAEPIINDLWSRGKVPIVCGGTMLYVKSLLEGISNIPDIDEETRTKAYEFMRSNSLEACYKFVTEVDPKFASIISPTDKQRISRALEIWFAFEKPLTYFWDQQEAKDKYRPFRIYVYKERAELYEHINKRMRNMISDGLIREIKSVLDLGYKQEDYGLNSVGYKEFIECGVDAKCKVIDEPHKLEQCIELAAQNTRNYAKRQITWYRKTSFTYSYSEKTDCISSTREKILEYFSL